MTQHGQAIGTDCLLGGKTADPDIYEMKFARARKGIPLKFFKKHLDPCNASWGGGLKGTPVL